MVRELENRSFRDKRRNLLEVDFFKYFVTQEEADLEINGLILRGTQVPVNQYRSLFYLLSLCVKFGFPDFALERDAQGGLESKTRAKKPN